MRVAGTAVTVFITGESGTGKEVVARTVHELSRRRKNAFLAVNCGAISPHLIESEIFGHEKGSFTGADRQHLGFFERASGGTLFLDEITEMPLDLQVKLLRVLETGTFMRVGSTQVQETDVRIIAATNRSPMEAVARGKLREDLLYRLNVFPIHLPPLRDRAEDIPLIAQHFLEQIAEREGQPKRFAPRAAQEPAPPTAGAATCASCATSSTAPTSWRRARPSSTTACRSCPARGNSGGSAPTVTVRVGMTLAEIERQVTLATLEHFGRHKEKTAATLGISLKTLYNRLKEYAAEEDPVSESGALDEAR